MTPRVISSLDDLNSSRRSDLLEIFHAISKKGKSIRVNQKSFNNSLIFGISDGVESGGNYRDWRFKTYVDYLTANYHEVWNVKEKDKYYLERSYFHLYYLDNLKSEYTEYILLHCDPCEPDDTPHSIYKQSPHLHIKAAEDPIPKAHFALYNGRLNEILKDLRSYDRALIDSIELLNSQILKMH